MISSTYRSIPPLPLPLPLPPALPLPPLPPAMPLLPPPLAPTTLLPATSALPMVVVVVAVVVVAPLMAVGSPTVGRRRTPGVTSRVSAPGPSSLGGVAASRPFEMERRRGAGRGERSGLLND